MLSPPGCLAMVTETVVSGRLELYIAHDPPLPRDRDAAPSGSFLYFLDLNLRRATVLLAGLLVLAHCVG